MTGKGFHIWFELSNSAFPTRMRMDGGRPGVEDERGSSPATTVSLALQMDHRPPTQLDCKLGVGSLYLPKLVLCPDPNPPSLDHKEKSLWLLILGCAESVVPILNKPMITSFSGLSVVSCINEEEGYLLPTWAWKITWRHFDWMLQLSSGQKWRSVNKLGLFRIETADLTQPIRCSTVTRPIFLWKGGVWAVTIKTSLIPRLPTKRLGTRLEGWGKEVILSVILVFFSWEQYGNHW